MPPTEDSFAERCSRQFSSESKLETVTIKELTISAASIFQSDLQRLNEDDDFFIDTFHFMEVQSGSVSKTEASRTINE